MPEWALVIVLILGVPILVGIWLIVRAVKSSQRIEELARRVGELELELFRLKKERPPAPAAQALAQAEPPIEPQAEKPSRAEIVQRWRETARAVPESAPAVPPLVWPTPSPATRVLSPPPIFVAPDLPRLAPPPLRPTLSTIKTAIGLFSMLSLQFTFVPAEKLG